MPSPASNLRYAGRTARRHGINPRIFKRQIRQESGGADVRSPAGAEGPAQIMPATAAAWGVNPHHDREALDAAAKHMAEYLRQYHGSWAKALTAYNAGPGTVGHALPAETQNYIHTILGGHGDVRNAPGRSGGGGGGPSAPGKLTQTDFGVKLGFKNQFDSSGFQLAQGSYLLGSLLSKRRGTNSPLFRTGALSLTAPVRSDFTQRVLTSKTTTSKHTFDLPGGGGGGGAVAGARGKVIGRPLDRPGVRTKPRVVRFVQQVAGIYGRPITLGTGTAHSQMTTSGNVSAHWDGDAIDLPARGRRLVQIGQAALIAAGMNPRQARRARGGLYNVNGAQIIFNTHIGGDHTNHVHVQPPRR